MRVASLLLAASHCGCHFQFIVIINFAAKRDATTATATHTHTRGNDDEDYRATSLFV